MIEKPTVLILGAGASMPYGFPSGEGLMQEILEGIRLNLGKELFRTLLNFGFEPNDIDDFYTGLKHSRKFSVDEFLERQPDFMKIGKIAITLTLSTYEKKDELFEQKSDKDWYRYLWVKLSDTTFEEFDKNQLSIITFNYDRSIEHFLFTTMRALYNRSEQDCAKMLKKIPIIHVHGRLGALPWQDENGRSYQSSIALDEVGNISNQIKVMKEQDDSPREFEEAHKILSFSQKICFLGFGYNPVNIRRLKIKEIIGSDPRRVVYGTSLNFGDVERRNIANSWGINVVPSHNEILEFLKNNFILD
ncbi:MAG: hypothetical protein HQ555_02035 [Candidatus Aminicenantes bacterium]|nr:hypothetical protein [Candidatus Aminicenantes bacterium]